MAAPVLKAQHLGIQFGGLKAVDDFNMEIGESELVGLIGPNGAGKTTVFNLITGVYKPTEGSFYLCGERMNGKKTHQIVQAGIARTFQNIRLFKKMTVIENVKTAMQEHTTYGMADAIFRTKKYWQQEAEITAPIGIGGAYAGLDGLRQSAQEAQHALGYAFSTGETLLFDPELRKSSGSLQTDDCPTAAQIASTLQSGSGSRALELTGTLFTCMRRRRVHESECRPVLQRLQILVASHLTREQLLRAPAMLLPQQGYALEEVRLSVERLEGYILQCQAQQNDTPAARCGRLAVAYINEHYADCDLKLPDVLEHLGVSRSYFSTVFKEKTGQSFVEYLTNLRMEKAKEYLRETGLCTYEIAERIGFADPHYFSLTFRRRTGMAPRQYREAESGT